MLYHALQHVQINPFQVQAKCLIYHNLSWHDWGKGLHAGPGQRTQLYIIQRSDNMLFVHALLENDLNLFIAFEIACGHYSIHIDKNKSTT